MNAREYRLRGRILAAQAHIGRVRACRPRAHIGRAPAWRLCTSIKVSSERYFCRVVTVLLHRRRVLKTATANKCWHESDARAHISRARALACWLRAPIRPVRYRTVLVFELFNLAMIVLMANWQFCTEEGCSYWKTFQGWWGTFWVSDPLDIYIDIGRYWKMSRVSDSFLDF